MWNWIYSANDSMDLTNTPSHLPTIPTSSKKRFKIFKVLFCEQFFFVYYAILFLFAFFFVHSYMFVNGYGGVLCTYPVSVGRWGEQQIQFTCVGQNKIQFCGELKLNGNMYVQKKMWKKRNLPILKFQIEKKIGMWVGEIYNHRLGKL